MTLTPGLTETVVIDEPTVDTTTQQQADYLAALVGEGKKYKDVNDLGKAYINADLHIRELQDKLDDLKRVNEELLNTRTNQPNPAPAPSTTPVTEPHGQMVSEDQISTLVENTLQKRQAAETAKQNVLKSKNLLLEKYGSNAAASAAIAKIKENPAIQKTVDDLSAVDPEACVKFVMSMCPPVEPAPNTPGVMGGPSAEALIASHGRLTYSQCKEIRKKDPKLYNSPAFRKKMEDAATSYANEGKNFFAT